MQVPLALTMALLTTTVYATAYTPSPEACRLRPTNCADYHHPTMGTGIEPFVGAAACSYDYPLGTVLYLQGAPSVTVDGMTFQAPNRLICLDRFGRTTRNQRLDIVLLYPAAPGPVELRLADAWGYRPLTVFVDFPDRPFNPLAWHSATRGSPR